MISLLSLFITDERSMALSNLVINVTIRTPRRPPVTTSAGLCTPLYIRQKRTVKDPKKVEIIL